MLVECENHRVELHFGEQPPREGGVVGHICIDVRSRAGGGLRLGAIGGNDGCTLVAGVIGDAGRVDEHGLAGGPG